MTDIIYIFRSNTKSFRQVIFAQVMHVDLFK